MARRYLPGAAALEIGCATVATFEVLADGTVLPLWSSQPPAG